MNKFYDSKVHMWSGLMSGMSYTLQRGLREISGGIGDVSFHSSMSGYDGWMDVAMATIARKAESVVLMGHSNGSYAATKCAHVLAPYRIKCYVCSFDATLMRIPDLGSNVPEALDIWAGFRKLKAGSDFTGNLVFADFGPDTHISVIENEHAQRMAIAFGRRWKA